MAFVYGPEYNVKLYGLEKIHPFDTCKYEKIAAHLTSIGVKSFVAPSREVSKEELLEIHTEEYIDSMNKSSSVASLCEMFPLKFVPNYLIQKLILSPMRYQVSGTIIAGEVALEKGCAINLGGGMHHASSNDGGGWCLFSDIPLSIKNLMKKGLISKAMVIDLDIHQGNGIERDLKLFKKNSVYMIDAYNHDLYPQDNKAKKSINIDIKVHENTRDNQYMKNVKDAMEKGLDEFDPDIVFYNAGTDILEGDPLNGGVVISPKGVVERDMLVMSTFMNRKIPIVMVLSGGYSKKSVQVISESLENIYKFLFYTF